MNGQQQAFKKGAIMGQVAKIIQQIQNGLYQAEAILPSSKQNARESALKMSVQDYTQ